MDKNSFESKDIANFLKLNAQGCIVSGEQKAAAIAERDITAAIMPSKALTKHMHRLVYPHYENDSGSIHHLSNGTQYCCS